MKQIQNCMQRNSPSIDAKFFNLQGTILQYQKNRLKTYFSFFVKKMFPISLFAWKNLKWVAEIQPNKIIIIIIIIILLII